VTPASFGGNACPHAIWAESIKIPHKAKISFFTTLLLSGLPNV